MVRKPEARVRGGLYGLLVGDAVGVPYEFYSADDLPPFDQIDLVPPAGFNRCHSAAPAGAWSDDGAQALCLLTSLLHRGELDIEDLGRRFVNWYDHGYLAAEGVVFDVGGQTLAAISDLRDGAPAEGAGPADEDSNGNGSLMRVLPLALWHTGTTGELIRSAMRQSVVTHGHPRAQLCCALYCLWASGELAQAEDPWGDAVEELRRFVHGDAALCHELEAQIRPEADPEGGGTGYVVDCLHSARYALLESNYERIVRSAISLGNDTDTTAAVAGGIAGIRHGYDSIPSRWLSGLADTHEVEPIARELVTLVCR